MLTKKIILDTDIGCDCDDTAAMAVLHELANEGKCEILAVTHCCKGPYYAGCIDAINRYYGREDIPVGAFPEDSKAPEGRDVYAGYAVKAFPNRFANGETCPHTVDVLRKTLIQAGDGEVTIAVTNTGTRPGYAVPQLYIHRTQGAVTSRWRQLCGFTKLYLQPGETRTVTIAVPEDSLRQFDYAMKEVLLPGKIEWFLCDSGETKLEGNFVI